jgi:S-adenosylmethionine:tRNA ribosyltransferase-isomerase
MRTSDFAFTLPDHLIAAYPSARREASRLLVVDRAAGRWAHRVFTDLPGYLAAGDLLVLNNTRVIPARVYGRKPSGGQVELLFLAEESRGRWRALARGKNLKPGTVVEVEGVELSLAERRGDAWLVETGPHLPGLLYRAGNLPLPPYIVQRRKALGHAEGWRDDAQRYQTVFAAHEGAVAAPTAGLHFTPELLAGLQAQGVGRAEVTLHVGPGTFLPVRGDDPLHHDMHSEPVVVPEETVAAVNAAKLARRHVTAVGTTVVRALEGAALQSGTLQAYAGDINLFVLPGFRFQVVDRLVTNFHLPESTLLMLVAAFAGRELVLDAYADAVKQEYRFYSYGDAMLIL